MVLRLMVLLAALLVFQPACAGVFQLPEHPPLHRYGDLLIDRGSAAAGMPGVFFSHWTHRTRYTCRVCHFELGFDFAVNQTGMTEADNRDGQYCGACHDGRAAFGPTPENCQNCHTGPAELDAKDFARRRQALPPAVYGNGINWTRALEKGVIQPLYSLYHPEERPLDYAKQLELVANWSMVKPAIFDHATHGQWLDCSNCHPDIFNIKLKGTRHFAMSYILERKFCGVCHLNVAFPLDECDLCHPGMQRN